MEGLNDLLNAFEDVGISRGTMNGQPLRLISDGDGGHHGAPGNASIRVHLREYEKKKGRAYSYPEQFRRLIRSEVAEIRAKKAGRSNS